MYARLSQLVLKPGTMSSALESIDAAAGAMKSLKGFKSVVFLSDVETNEVGSLSLWETKEDAEAALQAMGPKMAEMVGGFLERPPVTKLFEVHEPKG